MNPTRQQRPRIDETKYAGRWLALDPQTMDVVADGETLKAAEAEAVTRGVPDPVLYPVPESDGYFVGAV